MRHVNMSGFGSFPAETKAIWIRYYQFSLIPYASLRIPVNRRMMRNNFARKNACEKHSNRYKVLRMTESEKLRWTNFCERITNCKGSFNN